MRNDKISPDRQSPIEASPTLPLDDISHSLENSFIFWNVLMNISASRRPLNLQPFSNQIEREYACLRKERRHNSGCCIARSKGQLQVSHWKSQCLVCCKEYSHIRYDLAHPSRKSLEEPSRSFADGDIPNGGSQGRIHLLRTLRRKPSSKKIKRICCSRSNSTGARSSNETLCSCRQSIISKSLLQTQSNCAISRELNRTVRNVHQFCRDIALP